MGMGMHPGMMPGMMPMPMPPEMGIPFPPLSTQATYPNPAGPRALLRAQLPSTQHAPGSFQGATPGGLGVQSGGQRGQSNGQRVQGGGQWGQGGGQRSQGGGQGGGQRAQNVGVSNTVPVERYLREDAFRDPWVAAGCTPKLLPSGSLALRKR